MEMACLRSLLLEEKTLMLSLTELSLDERKGIINDDMELISSCRAKKEKSGSKLMRLEAKRTALMGKPLSEAAAALPETERQELISLGKEIKELARQVKALNATNIFLLKQGLAHLKYLEEKACPILKALPYNARGRLREVSRESLTSLMA